MMRLLLLALLALGACTPPPKPAPIYGSIGELIQSLGLGGSPP